MIQTLLDPLTYPFMLRGMLAVVLVGAVCATVGSYVVLRGMAFLGDALAHTILPGVALGFLLGGGQQLFVFIGGLLAAVLASLGIGAISKGERVREDTAIGIVFVGMFALGIALISTVRGYAVDLTHFLFGDVLGVSANDLLLMAALGVLVIGTVLAFYKEFMVISFDPVLAATLRLPIGFLNGLMLVLVAVAVVVALQTVGVALTIAMLVTPAATASLLTRRLAHMMVLAVVVAVVAGIAGLYASFYFAVASGAAIVIVCTLVFVLVWLAQAGHQRRLNG